MFYCFQPKGIAGTTTGRFFRHHATAEQRHHGVRRRFRSKWDLVGHVQPRVSIASRCRHSRCRDGNVAAQPALLTTTRCFSIIFHTVGPMGLQKSTFIGPNKMVGVGPSLTYSYSLAHQEQEPCDPANISHRNFLCQNAILLLYVYTCSKIDYTVLVREFSVINLFM